MRFERPVGARSTEEIRLAAALRFEDVFGVEADAWAIKLDRPPLADAAEQTLGQA